MSCTDSLKAGSVCVIQESHKINDMSVRLDRLWCC